MMQRDAPLHKCPNMDEVLGSGMPTIYKQLTICH